MTNGLWKKIANLSNRDLRRELMEYPDTASLRTALKGYMSASETNVKTKEILNERVLERRKKGSFISEIGRKKQ